MLLGEKLHQLRKGKGMSQEELASRLAVSRQAISKWELGESVPDTENVILLGRLFGVSTDYILRADYEIDRDAPAVKASLPVNSERALVRMIREICTERGIGYKSFSYDWIINLTKDGRSRVIFGYGFPLKSATSAALCTDKAAASALMGEYGIPCVHHHFFMNPSRYKYTGGHGNWRLLIDLLAREQTLVCKPNEGTCGNQVYRVDNLPALENAVADIFSLNRSMAVCRYHDIRSEHRVVLLDGQALVIYEKELPYVIGDGHSTTARLTAQKYPAYREGLSGSGRIPAPGVRVNVGWKHNLDQGAAPKLIDLSNPLARDLEKLAADAASVCGVRFASVDIINAGGEPGCEPLVLEINSGVMMENFAAISGEFYSIAKGVYEKAISAMW